MEEEVFDPISISRMSRPYVETSSLPTMSTPARVVPRGVKRKSPSTTEDIVFLNGRTRPTSLFLNGRTHPTSLFLNGQLIPLL